MSSLATLSTVTLADVRQRISSVAREDRRWHRSSPTAAGPDGVATLQWFGLDDRERQARALAALERPSPMRVLELRKATGGQRRIALANRADQTVLYALCDLVAPIINRTLSAAAVGFRPGHELPKTILSAIKRSWSERLVSGFVADAANCFDTFSHRHLDHDLEGLTNRGVSVDVVDVLKRYIRIPYVYASGRVEDRSRGLPQGGVLSPLLANLAFNAADRRMRRRLAHLGVQQLRYADDILAPAPNLAQARRALPIVVEELHRIGLELKPGTGHLYDLRNSNNPCRWLGIAYDAHRVHADPTTLERKTARYAALLDAGVLDAHSVRLRLNDLLRYYTHILSEEEAGRAVSEVLTHLTLHSRLPIEDDPIRRLQRQVTPRGTRDIPSAGDSLSPGRPCNPSPWDQARPARSGVRLSLLDATNPALTTARPLPETSVPACSRDSYVANIRSEPSARGASTREDRSTHAVASRLGVECFPLARAGASLEAPAHHDHAPARHHGRGPSQSLVAEPLERTWDVRVYTTAQRRSVQIDALSATASWRHSFDCARMSPVALIVRAYVVAYAELVDRHDAKHVRLYVTNPVLVGYLRRRWRPRSPVIAGQLNTFFEQARRRKVGWSFVTPEDPW